MIGMLPMRRDEAPASRGVDPLGGNEMLVGPLWRALAVAWLGGIGSPMLTDDPMQFERLIEERPAALTPGAPAVATLGQPPSQEEQT